MENNKDIIKYLEELKENKEVSLYEYLPKLEHCFNWLKGKECRDLAAEIDKIFTDISNLDKIIEELEEVEE